MAHNEQRAFVGKLRSAHPQYFTNTSVLEVGSLDINGSLRDFFESCSYVGLDVGEGRGVDIVCPGQDYDAPDRSYDVVCSAECFEHNPYWLETFKNMVRMCKDEGLVFFTCATAGRPEHGTTRTTPADSPLTVDWDYYKNLTWGDFTGNVNFDSHFTHYGHEINHTSHDLYFWGVKKPYTPLYRVVL